MSELAWNNFLVYNAQVALLVAAATLLPWVFRMRSPQARLVYWHIVLVACLALPLIEPWQRSVMVLSGETGTGAVAGAAIRLHPARTSFPWRDLLLAALAAGVLVRASWLAVGFRRLRHLRRVGRPLAPVPEGVAALECRLMAWPELLVSDDVAGPVTFGVNDAVVLLPPRFVDLGPDMQAAVVCHELLHIRRRDWLFTVMEECVRAVFWFHPAVWWLLGQVQLTREQAVDREVVRLTGARDPYLEALLAISGARQQLDLAPAPLFLKRRHLTARVASMVEEVDMAKRWLWSSLAASLAALFVTGWLVVGTLPLKATPQAVVDAEGVTVAAGENGLMHRAPVEYPRDARVKGIQGTVVVEAQIGDDGTVADAAVVSGPPELRRAALQSVLQWHYARNMAGNRVQVPVNFKLPAGKPPEAKPAMAVKAAPEVLSLPGGKVARIDMTSLPEAARTELLEKLPLREGAEFTMGDFFRALQIVREYDEHLTIAQLRKPGEDGVIIRIAPPHAPVATASEETLPPPPPGVQRIRVGGNVQQLKLTKQPKLAYPPLAKEARIQGVVRLNALIDAEGKMKNLQVITGHPLLVQAATEAVRQWEYAPTLLNGNPVEVVTQVDVNFTLRE